VPRGKKNRLLPLSEVVDDDIVFSGGSERLGDGEDQVDVRCDTEDLDQVASRFGAEDGRHLPQLSP
jgi:hypothetical protein